MRACLIMMQEFTPDLPPFFALMLCPSSTPRDSKRAKLFQEHKPAPSLTEGFSLPVEAPEENCKISKATGKATLCSARNLAEGTELSNKKRKREENQECSSQQSAIRRALSRPLDFQVTFVNIFNSSLMTNLRISRLDLRTNIKVMT